MILWLEGCFLGGVNFLRNPDDDLMYIVLFLRGEWQMESKAWRMLAAIVTCCWLLISGVLDRDVKE